MTPTEPGPAPKSYDKYDLTVRFGASDTGDLKRMTLPRLQPLPKDDLPVVIYLGVSKDGKSAHVPAGEGRGGRRRRRLRPDPEDCETLRLGVGETEFLDVTDEDRQASRVSTSST